MNSRKLRALALILSAIMILTAIPSTMFAEDFVGEETGWDAEVVTDDALVADDFDLGFSAEAESFDAFDGFTSDELVAGVMDIAEELWDETTKIVTVKFSDTLSETGTMTRLEYKDDCTKYYYTATVVHAGETYVIYSTSNQNASGKVITITAPGSDGDNGGQIGLYTDATKSHTWDDGTPYDMEFSCTGNKYKLEYKCTVCGKLGYMANGATTITAAPSDENGAKAAKDGAKVVETEGTGHIKPTDASLITVTNIVDSAVLTADASIVDALTGKKVSELGYKVENMVTTSATNPTAADSTKDAYWVVKTAYKCTKCNQDIAEYTQQSIMVRKIAYGNFKNVVLRDGKTMSAPDGLTAVNFGLTNTDQVYAGTDYEVDKANFEVEDCTKSGSYVEYWYTTEGEVTGSNATKIKITHTIDHTVDPHTYKKTVYASKAVKVGETSTGDTVDDLKKLYKLTAKNVPEMSLSCKDAPYYEIVTCQCKNHKDVVLSCTEKVAPGNEEAHQYNTDINDLVKAGDVVLATKEIVPKTYTNIADLIEAYAKKDTVKFANPTYTCTEDGTIDITYTCAICKKEVALGTFKVKAPGHVWTWVDIDPKQDATCTVDGFVTQQSQCKVCATVNPALGVRKAVIPKLNHKGIENVKTYYISIEDGGDIVGDSTKFKKGDVLTNVETTETGAQYDNLKVVNARVYKICPLCGLPVYDKDLTTAKEEPFVDSFTLKVDDVVMDTKSCSNGTITITASCPSPASSTVTLTATGTYDYWKNNNAYQARTQHAPKEMADGSIVCLICGKVIKEAPVVTTEAPTVATTEAAPVATTAAPATEVTTVAPETTAPTTAAPETTAPTTVAPETTAPTTVAPETIVPTTEAPVEPTTAEPATMPAQVTGEKITKNSPTKQTIGVKYDAVEGADQYTVNVREPNGTWTKNLTDGAVTAYDITGLEAGKLYDIRIAAIANGIAGPRSGHLYRWLQKVTLDKPKKVKGVTGAVTVTWTAADGASKYKLYYSTDKSFKDAEKVLVTEPTAEISGLEVGVRYYFKVRCYAKGADGKTYTGGWSNVKSKLLQ